MSASKKRKFIAVLDVLLLILFLLLLSPRLTGLSLHEILGLSLIIPIIIHMLSSWQWIQITSKKVFTTVKVRTRINYVINAILFILVIIVIVSGFFISEIAVPSVGINIVKDTSWRSVHVQTTTFVMLFSGLHIAINLDWFVSLFKKRLKIPAKGSIVSNNAVQTIQRISVLVMAILIVAFALIYSVGMPTITRLYNHSYVKEYTPTLKNGIGQFLGETFFVIVIAILGRKLLRIKL